MGPDQVHANSYEGRLIGRVALLLITMLAGSVEGGALPAEAASPPPLEYQVKAAFLYQFIKFIEWPPQTFQATRETVVVGVLGESLMTSALPPIEGKEAKGRRVVVKQFKGVEELEFCHVLFISSSAEGHLGSILKTLKGSSTLTVSDMDGFARRGGMINFIVVENKIQFEINVEAAERANLKISSQLLRLARVVQGEQ